MGVRGLSVQLAVLAGHLEEATDFPGAAPGPKVRCTNYQGWVQMVDEARCQSTSNNVVGQTGPEL